MHVGSLDFYPPTGRLVSTLNNINQEVKMLHKAKLKDDYDVSFSQLNTHNRL